MLLWGGLFGLGFVYSLDRIDWMAQCLAQSGSLIDLITVKEQVSVLAQGLPEMSGHQAPFPPPHWYSTHMSVCRQISRDQTRAWFMWTRGSHISGNSGAYCCLSLKAGRSCDSSQRTLSHLPAYLLWAAEMWLFIPKG